MLDIYVDRWYNKIEYAIFTYPDGIRTSGEDNFTWN